MNRPDGTIIIGTKVETSGLKKGFEKIKSGLAGIGKTAAKAGLAISAAFGAAAIAITKQAVDAYADYEQLVGGVETLFKGASDKVIAYAEDAFYTVGLSANEYMETVTSFSASLISSLGGDTEKAADVANMALVDMADNANKMGTEMGSIQNAYQGFAKQNYTMLDNLKLGYGGTKTEMERLLKDAQALTGQKYDISNLSDVYNAIHAIQVNLGITGTTAKEAEKTNTGSANMMKSAWKNVLAAISGGGDIDRAINNLTYSISKYFDNIVPVVRRAIAGIGTLIKEIAPQLVQTVATELIKAIPDLLEAVYQMIIGLAQGIYQGIVALFKGGTTKEISAQFSSAADSAENAAGAAGDLAEETEEAGKAAKRALAGFDELNILNAGEEAEETGGSTITPSVTVSPSISVDTNEVEAETGGLVSAVTSVLDDLREKLKEYAQLFDPTIEAWKRAFSKLSQSLKAPFQKIGKSFSSLLNDTLAPFGQYLLEDFVPSIVNSFSDNLAPIFTDLMALAVEGFAVDFENATLAIDEACGWLEVAFDDVKMVFSDMLSSIKEKWDEYGGSIMDGILEFKEGLWETIWNIYNDIIKPVLENISEKFDWLWTNHLKPLWDNIVEFVMSVVDNILQLWNGFLKPIVDWVITVLSPIVRSVIDAVVDAVTIAAAFISDIISAILKVLGGLIDFIVGVFTLDFKKAWEGIKEIFAGLWNGIISVLETAVNAIIWGINSLVDLVYSAIAGVVNGLGSIVEKAGDIIGKDWGFSIPTQAPAISYISIPKLAQGAVIPANHEFMAVLGDQKHGTNIEAPLATIQEAVALVMEDMTNGFMAGFEALLAENQRLRAAVEGIEIGDKTIGQAANRYNQKMAVMRGV